MIDDGYSYSVYQRKSTKKWYCEIKYNGKKLKSFTLKATIKRDASVEGKALFDAYDRNQKPEIVQMKDTIAAYCMNFWSQNSRYIQAKSIDRDKPLSSAYIKNNHSKAAKEISEFFGALKFEELSRGHIEDLKIALKNRGYSQRQINAVLHALRVPYYYWCQENDKARRVTITKPKEQKTERGVLTVDEVKRIVRLDYPDARVKCAILLGCLCGLRAGEIRGLQWRDIDEQNEVIIVRHSFVDADGLKSTKTDKARTVPLPGVLKPCLEEVKRIHGKWPENFVLQSIKKDVAGAPISKGAIERGFKTILEQVGISAGEAKRRNICFHSTRHTYITLARHLGITGVVVQKIAGHSTTDMMDNYTHADIGSIQNAGRMLDDALNA